MVKSRCEASTSQRGAYFWNYHASTWQNDLFRILTTATSCPPSPLRGIRQPPAILDQPQTATNIEVDKAYYSLPPEYLGNEVWVRWNSQVVRVYDERMREITIHVRQEPGRFSTHGRHIATEKVNGVERGAKYLLRKACILGPQTARWSEAMIADRGIVGVRVLQGLLSLAKQYSSEAIEEACEIAWSHQAFHLRTLRSLLKRAGDRQVTMEFLDEHPIIRPMSEYGDLVRKSFQGE